MFHNSGHNHKCVVNPHLCGANQRHRCVSNRLHAHNHSRDQQRRHLVRSRSRSNRNVSKSRRSQTGRRKASRLLVEVKVRDPKSRNRF